jgi:hypothetical protein
MEFRSKAGKKLGFLMVLKDVQENKCGNKRETGAR